ncbi:NADH dehydrogenase subunit F [Dehalococcoides mccartyi]|uniref:NADH dehydrogenase subunit F n=1 Tax=Dehalococcoides mccartyi TaxID=61435 RepID=A0A2J1DTN6_9CHLR|nr:NADH dehydrogenase subunit F [Dehalococcoides mccartyi]
MINSDTSMVNVASNVAHFFDEEGCGKCSICREGTRRAAEILSRFSRGQGNRNELEWLLELHEVMKDTASCGLGQVALNVAASAIRNFKGEFLAQVRRRKAYGYAKC